MRTLLIYVNDQLLDLYGKTDFQLTLNNLDIGDLTGRSTSFTNAIKIPKTQNNLAIFGNNTLKNNSSRPYQQPNVRVIDNGVQIFAGTCYVKSKSDSISLSIGSDDIAFFEELKTKKLSDISGDSLFSINNTDIYSLRNGEILGFEVGTVAPVLNWGKLTNPPSNSVPNYNFASALDPWENQFAGTGVPNEADWNYVSGKPRFTESGGDGSKMLMNPDFVFYAGYKYRVTITFTTSSTSTVTMYMDSVKSFGTSFTIPIRENLGSQSYSTIGTHTLVVEFSPESVKYNGIGIYGVVSGSSNTIILQDVIVDANYQKYIDISFPFYLPVYRYVYALDEGLKLFGNSGLIIKNLNPEQEEYLDNLAIAYSRDSVRYADSYVEFHRVEASADGTQLMNINHPALREKIKFPIQTKIDYGEWNSVRTVYTSPTEITSYYADIQVDLVVDFFIDAFNEASLEIVAGSDSFESEVFTTSGIKHISLTTNAKIDKGILMNNTQICANIKKNNFITGGVQAEILSATIKITQVPFPQDEVFPSGSLILPDITVFDLLTDYVIRTGSLTRYNKLSDSFEVQCIENIIANRHLAKNWTAKRNKHVNDEETYEVNGYAKTNYFQDTDPEVNVTAKMSLDIVNENIEQEKVYYESEFKTLKDQGIQGIQVANLNIWDFESEKRYRSAVFPGNGSDLVYEFESEESISLLKLRSELSTDPEIKYGSTTATDYTVANYAPWTDFKRLFYGNLESSLYKTKVIKREYRLTALDINSLDMFKLIYDDGDYFLIQSIKYVPDGLSKATLLRVGNFKDPVEPEPEPPEPVFIETGTGNIIFTGLVPTVTGDL